MGYYKDLIVYKKSYELAMDIFNLTRNFPKDEKYSMVDQIRRSSRSVCTNLAEAYRRRQYRDYFISKLNDCGAENAETQIWLDFAKDCGYITEEIWKELSNKNNEVGKLIWYMSCHPEKFRGTPPNS